MVASARKQITSLINDMNDMTIATLRDDGFPQATTVSYVSDGITIYFGTSADSQKARNIERDNRVSLTIDRPYDSWPQIESLSMGALASLVTDRDEQAKVIKLLMEKFPQISEHMPENESLIAFIRIDPIVVSLLDYSKGFGHSDLIMIGED